MSVDERSLGQVAYGAWREAVEGRTVAWSQLAERDREGWRAAADAVLDRRAAHVEQRRLTLKHDTAITAIEVAPLGPKGVVPTLHAKTGDVLACSPDGSEVYVQRGDARGHEVVAHYVDDGLGVLRPVTP